MFNYETMKPTNRNVTFYDSHNIVKRWGINLYEEKELLPTLVKLANDWKINYNAIVEFIKSNQLVCKLFEYSIYNSSHTKLVAEKGVYEEKKVWKNGRQVITQIYHNVYIRESEYISLIVPNIIKFIIETYYPKFAIYKQVKRFNDKIIIKPNMTIDDICREYRGYKLTANDIANLLNNPQYSNEHINKLKYDIYGNGDIIFYPITSLIIHGHKFDISLYIPREAIINNDWSIVENYKLFSIIKPNANELLGRDKNNWFEGKQKDNPYWNCKEVKMLKKIFEKVLN